MPGTNRRDDMTYLTETQIDDMADAAVTAFEFTADRNAALRAAAEYAKDEWGVTPRKSAVLLAMKRAGLSWEARRMQAKRACA
jgi:transposase